MFWIKRNVIFIVIGTVLFACYSAQAQDSHLAKVFEKSGNIYFFDEKVGEIQLTSSGRDREPKLHPNDKWVYFVRSFEGEFKGEVYYPIEGREPEDGILKMELCRIDADGKNEKMLYQNSTAAIDHPSGYAYASIDNIQFSPKGDKVYFETARWVTSAALNVMEPDGSNIRMLGPGNDTKIVLSARTFDDREKSYEGYIVTAQHRYWFYGGSYDWYYLFTPDLKKEIAPLGYDTAYFTDVGDIKYTDHSEKEIFKEEQEIPVELPETDEFAEAIQEANKNFTFKGKPIHPGLIKEFAGWISDSWQPITTSVDIAAAFDTNEYFDSEVEVKDNEYIFWQEEGRGEYFYYKWLGQLKNGLHVVETGDGGGGSGIFQDIYFVRFDVDEGLDPEGKKYNRLLMTVVSNHALGDRDDGEIKVISEENKVILGKSKYRDKQVVIEF